MSDREYTDDMRIRDLLLPGMLSAEARSGLELDVKVNVDGIWLELAEPRRRMQKIIATRTEVDSGAYKVMFTSAVNDACAEFRRSLEHGPDEVKP